MTMLYHIEISYNSLYKAFFVKLALFERGLHIKRPDYYKLVHGKFTRQNIHSNNSDLDICALAASLSVFYIANRCNNGESQNVEPLVDVQRQKVRR